MTASSTGFVSVDGNETDLAASTKLDEAFAGLVRDLGRGFPSVDLVESAARLFDRWLVPERRSRLVGRDPVSGERLLGVVPLPPRLPGDRVPMPRVSAAWEAPAFVVAPGPRRGLTGPVEGVAGRCMVEGPRWRVEVSPGVVAVRRSDPVRRERARERADRSARERAELVLRLERSAVRSSGCTLPVGHPMWHPDCRCEAWFERHGVSRLYTWSSRSRARMQERLAQLDYEPLFAAGGVPAMVTLTYPGDWLAVVPSPRVARRHVEALRKRWYRRWGVKLVGVWKREFQERGAPHWHLLCTPPDDPGFRAWLSVTWAEIVGSAWCGDWCWQREGGACCEYGRHVLAGTGVDYREGARATDPRRLSTYFAKHGLYAAKDYQNSAPIEWAHDDDCDARSDDPAVRWASSCEGCAPDGVGRFWGVWGLDKVVSAVEVHPDAGRAAGRTIRRHAHANRYYVDATVWRKQHRPAVDTSTGEIEDRWRWRRRRSKVPVERLAYGTGYVVVNDGPSYAAQLARAVERQVSPRRSWTVIRLPSGRGRVTASGRGPVGFLP